MRTRPDVAVRWGAGIAIATMAIVLYLPALRHGFVVDDHHLMTGNPHVEDPSRLLEAFTVGMWEFAGRTPTYYRPLMYVAYAAVHHLVGAAPSWFHALNVLMHAVAAGLVFGAHPAQAEAVLWVAALVDNLRRVRRALAVDVTDPKASATDGASRRGAPDAPSG